MVSCGLLTLNFIRMDKSKKILYKHAKSNGCKSDLSNNPFLEQAVLNAINEALTIPAVVGQSEQLCDCGKPVESAYDPCCSLTCWCEMFEGA